ncbi:hypothetical protein [Marinitenerispora sediminis]|uniref:Uncharacterized protein n=1 Tax=Marinitenerispora sediminis TaxID=1931232 RepID=A0A368T3J0_9ACTN|nr:hypothetical protein [Marinitenerispora sediminis]RCV49365.1 hypothetical protein DEF28_20985 [Marinitenerispora sediminis]RCV55984.1 hypothetical protein DEF23_13350 [Marinitenerispora sediminis]RCV56599.1 hypothetical protein DEF24_16365 [Marinitenerispora sediminis]
MTKMRTRAFTAVRALFKLGLLTCFALGALLVAGQLAGVILQRPEWVAGTSDLLFVPAVTAAAAFGVLGFVAGYLAPRGED